VELYWRFICHGIERLGSVLTAKILITERRRLLCTPKLPLLKPFALTLGSALPTLAMASSLSVGGSATEEATVAVAGVAGGTCTAELMVEYKYVTK
jgi:hypothetical protein